ncbi:MAG TPA: SulP family inorganic anion transporter [Symbiobacteriaceae bacterium]|nr:SulP family inorganic anion transporter [Symbiobacteriaceae bacterium]
MSWFGPLGRQRIDWTTFRGDLFGGLTAAVVALPLALAVGVAAGAGPASGIYGAIVTGVLASLCGGTATQITGPTLTTLVVVAGAYAHGGWPELVLSTLICGLIQIGLGILRTGRFIAFIPQTVVAGFTNGMAAYIFVQQFSSFRQAPLVGLAAILLMILWPRVSRTIPASLVALLGSAGLAVLLGWTDSSYLLWGAAPTIGAIPSGLPDLHLPTWSLAAIQPAFANGLTLALIASMETLLSSRIVDEIMNKRHHYDQELIGQGIANVVAPLVHALPGNGAMIRSIVNTRSGGRTRLSGVIHGLVILLVLLLFGSLASRIPVATLSGILMMTAVGMIDWQSIREMRAQHVTDSIVGIVTTVMTFTLPLIFAIGAGMLLSVILFTIRMSQSLLTVKPLGPNLTAITVEGPLFFGDAGALEEQVRDLSGTVLLCLEPMRVIDTTGAVTLKKLGRRMREDGNRLVLTGLQPAPRRTLERLGVLQEMDSFPNLDVALDQIAE